MQLWLDDLLEIDFTVTDIKVLAARINVAGTQIGEAKAGALPTMDLGAGADFEKPRTRPSPSSTTSRRR